MFCHRCGHRLRNNDLFCRACGTRRLYEPSQDYSQDSLPSNPSARHSPQTDSRRYPPDAIGKRHERRHAARTARTSSVSRKVIIAVLAITLVIGLLSAGFYALVWRNNVRRMEPEKALDQILEKLTNRSTERIRSFANNHFKKEFANQIDIDIHFDPTIIERMAKKGEPFLKALNDYVIRTEFVSTGDSSQHQALVQAFLLENNKSLLSGFIYLDDGSIYLGAPELTDVVLEITEAILYGPLALQSRELKQILLLYESAFSQLETIDADALEALADRIRVVIGEHMHAVTRTQKQPIVVAGEKFESFDRYEWTFDVYDLQEILIAIVEELDNSDEFLDLLDIFSQATNVYIGWSELAENIYSASFTDHLDLEIELVVYANKKGEIAGLELTFIAPDEAPPIRINYYTLEESGTHYEILEVPQPEGISESDVYEMHSGPYFILMNAYKGNKKKDGYLKLIVNNQYAVLRYEDVEDAAVGPYTLKTGRFTLEGFVVDALSERMRPITQVEFSTLSVEASMQGKDYVLTTSLPGFFTINTTTRSLDLKDVVYPDLRNSDVIRIDDTKAVQSAINVEDIQRTLEDILVR